MKALKCVVVGDAAVGKTCMLITYMKGTFPEEYVPTVFENYFKVFQVGKQKFKMSIWDTAGSEDFDRMRALFYPGGHVFIVCFSVVSPTHEAFDGVTTRWKDEMAVHVEGKPFLLVGTKIDLRDDDAAVKMLAKQGLKPITTKQGKALADEIGACGYYECSAKTQTGLGAIFQAAANVAASVASGGGGGSSSSADMRDSATPSRKDKGRSGCIMV